MTVVVYYSHCRKLLSLRVVEEICEKGWCKVKEVRKTTEGRNRVAYSQQDHHHTVPWHIIDKEHGVSHKGDIDVLRRRRQKKGEKCGANSQAEKPSSIGPWRMPWQVVKWLF